MGFTPLLNVYMTNENHRFVHGTTYYFDWAIVNSYVKLPGSSQYMMTTTMCEIQFYGISLRDDLHGS